MRYIFCALSRKVVPFSIEFIYMITVGEDNSFLLNCIKNNLNDLAMQIIKKKINKGYSYNQIERTKIRAVALYYNNATFLNKFGDITTPPERLFYP